MIFTGKFFLNQQNPESYAAASQFVNEAITSAIADNSLFEKSLSCELDVSPKANRSPKTPVRSSVPEPTKNESPIVEKKSRNNKRKFLCISSLRKNKQSNGDPVRVADPLKFDDDDFNETKLLNDTEKPTKIPETCDNVTPAQNSLASPEILTSMSQCNRSIEAENEKILDETPKFGRRRSRRSLDMDLADATMLPEAKRKTPESTCSSREPNRGQPMDLEIAKAIEPLPEIPVVPKEKPAKTVWHLKRSREQLTNSKLKQTLLSTASLEKKVDISTSSEYKGGSAVQLNVIKSEATKVPSKENVEETFFEPAITSTHNDSDDPAPQSKAGALAESTNKPRTPRKIDDSFDCLPSTSPKYKYQRDAIRKKSERWKLPGQECANCRDFYEAKRAELSDTQIRKLLNKCSRHRHKHPIEVYTPPGLWNPVFDDTDDELDVK